MLQSSACSLVAHDNKQLQPGDEESCNPRCEKLRPATKKATTVRVTCCNQRRRTCGRRRQMQKSFKRCAKKLQPAKEYASSMEKLQMGVEEKLLTVKKVSTGKKKASIWQPSLFLATTAMCFATFIQCLLVAGIRAILCFQQKMMLQP